MGNRGGGNKKDKGHNFVKEEPFHHLSKRKYIAPIKGVSGEKKKKAVPRVLRQAEKFFCGICRSKFFSGSEANGCLDKCIPGFLEQQCITSRQVQIRVLYTCSLCAKDRSDRKTAEICLKKCKDAVLEGTFGRPKEVADKIRAQRLAQQKADAENADDLAKEQIEEQIAAAKAVQAAATAGGEKIAAIPSAAATIVRSAAASNFTRKPNQKPFYRDGARYICSACKEKFFTKSEVEACFENHPEG